MIRNVILVLFLGSSVAFAEKFIPTKIRFIVVDDSGGVITGMPVRASFPVIWGTRDQALFQGYIDDKGQYTIEGDSTGEIFAFFEAKGYYEHVSKRE